MGFIRAGGAHPKSPPKGVAFTKVPAEPVVHSPHPSQQIKKASLTAAPLLYGWLQCAIHELIASNNSRSLSILDQSIVGIHLGIHHRMERLFDMIYTHPILFSKS